MYSFTSGCGMDDGPFNAVLIDPIEISDSAQVFELLNNGKMILENRNDTLSTPIDISSSPKHNIPCSKKGNDCTSLQQLGFPIM
jgi:hypothetical protein